MFSRGRSLSITAPKIAGWPNINSSIDPSSLHGIMETILGAFNTNGISIDEDDSTPRES